ncbi:PREDICTED: uncharacterized protein LOC104588170 isoform X2 [Nelumbo nucifera]|uniref:Uncharacterized protein LOC104588170 isoform X2 n=1 Tax=Nelumbo nucifera TaxID=4432 RepID=A0A1U7Z9C8_NELNU|nr:PREDICTED: uncharacterized protein LOC104588170 isoform X2 [Nelumbo nucifera]
MKQQNPSWIFSLLSEKFFDPCVVHENAKKNEKNTFCLDCCITICPHCLNLHNSHRLLQVRRYVYHDVIRLDDMEKLFDCGFVQRPQTRTFKGSGSFCNSCDRNLQEPFQFCSLACKVRYLVDCDGFDCEYLPLSNFVYAHIERVKELEDGDGQVTPSSVLDGDDEMMVSYRKSPGSICTNSDIGCLTVGCTARTEKVTRKKRSTKFAAESSCYYRNTPLISSSSKRKGIPFRSPLY